MTDINYYIRRLKRMNDNLNQLFEIDNPTPMEIPDNYINDILNEKNYIGPWNKGKIGVQVAWNKGRKGDKLPAPTIETRAVIRNNMKELWANPEFRLKQSQAMRNKKKSKPVWNKGLTKEIDPRVGRK